MEEKLKYLNRKSTKYIRVLFEPEKKTKKQIYVEQRKEGLFNIGYHFILLTNGKMEEGIPFYAYADYRLTHTDDSVYILAVGCKDATTMTNSQKKSLQLFSKEKHLEILYEDD